MARLFILASLLEEGNFLDNYESRLQAERIRKERRLLRNQDYVVMCRLSEERIETLEHDLIPLLRRSRRQGITFRTKILCTLSFLASGSYQKSIGKNVNTFLSQSATSRCISEVVEALTHPSIVKKYIRFPQNANERQILKEKFYEKFKIPGVIGCIDGTFVAMIRPKEHEERFYCRKGNHARNIQLITDADLNILHINPTYGGATHDSFIFNNSEIKDHLESLVNNGETVFLLGDSGYPQRPYLMVPIPNANEGTPEAHYNKLHATARNTVERAIGLLKGRFRCLLVHRVLHYHPDMVAKIVIACSVLHNICNRADLPATFWSDSEAQGDANFRLRLERTTQNIDEGQIHRQELVNTLWRARHVN